MKRAAENRWRYAQEKEVAYQKDKIGRFGGQTQPLQELGRTKTRQARQLLEQLGLELRSDAVVLEIGSGAHGLIWHWPACLAIGLDPLAHFYRGSLDFQQRSETCSLQATGERIPLAPASVDLVLTENVLDHTQDPPAILAEVSRVLKPGGVLYCLVDVHHWLWGQGARIYNGLFAIGLRPRVPAYPHHPFHFRKGEFMKLIDRDRFDLVYERTYQPGRPQAGTRWRHTLMKRFPKNVALAIVAVAK